MIAELDSGQIGANIEAEQIALLSFHIAQNVARPRILRPLLHSDIYVTVCSLK
jgi:hypothetical protein